MQSIKTDNNKFIFVFCIDTDTWYKINRYKITEIEEVDETVKELVEITLKNEDSFEFSKNSEFYIDNIKYVLTKKNLKLIIKKIFDINE